MRKFEFWLLVILLFDGYYNKVNEEWSFKRLIVLFECYDYIVVYILGYGLILE